VKNSALTAVMIVATVAADVQRTKQKKCML